MDVFIWEVGLFFYLADIIDLIAMADLFMAGLTALYAFVITYR